MVNTLAYPRVPPKIIPFTPAFNCATRFFQKSVFPSAKCESMGMEDLRLVRFQDGEKVCYYGTYTAYNEKQIKTQFLETTDLLVLK